MSDPVFTTREAMQAWEREQVALAVDSAWNPDFSVLEMVSTGNRINRVRAAHAHLLTPESDNGHI